MLAGLHPSVAWLPVVAGAFALGAAIWLLIEVRRATRQRGVVPIEAILIDDQDADGSDGAIEALYVDEPEAPEPPMHSLVPLYVFASTLPDQPVPVFTDADRAIPRPATTVAQPVPDPVIDLSSVTSQLAALTEAVARIADRLDPLVVPVQAVPTQAAPVQAVPVQPAAPSAASAREREPLHVYVRSAPSFDDDDLLSWPSDDEVNRFNGYDGSP